MRTLQACLVAVVMLAGCGTSASPPAAPAPAASPAPTAAPDRDPQLPSDAGHGSITANTNLRAVQMMGAERGWAWGGGNLYRTDDKGRTWTVVTPPGATITDGGNPAFFLDADKAWVAAGQAESLALYRTTDAGRTWQSTTMLLQGQGGGQLYFLDARQGWLLAHLGAAMSHEQVAVYHTSDGGVTWSKLSETDPGQDHPGAVPFAGDKSGIAFRDANTGWITGFTPASGHIYLYVTHDGGATWAEQPLAVPPALAQQQLGTLPPRIFGPEVAVLPVQSGTSILFYVTHDGGKSWTAGAPVARSQTQDALLWAFADVANGLVADGNRLWRTTDGGATWSGGQPVPALQGLRQLDYNGIGCWAVVGPEPPTRLRVSLDAGQTWLPK